jgi:hypothetical protein
MPSGTTGPARRCDHGLPLAPHETGCESLGHARKGGTTGPADAINHNRLREHFLAGIDAAVGSHRNLVEFQFTLGEAGLLYSMLLERAAARGCIGYPECDGDLVATPHSLPCPKAGPADAPQEEMQKMRDCNGNTGPKSYDDGAPIEPHLIDDPLDRALAFVATTERLETMNLTEEQIRELVAQFEEALRRDDCEVTVEAGFVRRPNHKARIMEHSPTGGRTITITIGGGGGTVEESPMESHARLMRDLSETEK